MAFVIDVLPSILALLIMLIGAQAASCRILSAVSKWRAPTQKLGLCEQQKAATCLDELKLSAHKLAEEISMPMIFVAP